MKTLIGLGLVLWGCGASSRRGDSDGDADVDADTDGDTDGDSDGDSDVPADCKVHPEAAGCPCDELEVELCYSGPEGTAGVGICENGVHTCDEGRWPPCEGEVLPAEEVCDDSDDDCDGEIDEGVTDACGACGPDCDGTVEDLGPEDAFPIDGDDVNVRLDAIGALVLVDTDVAGRWLALFELTSADNGWDCIAWMGQSVTVSVRTADDLDDLDALEWEVLPPGAGFPSDPSLRFLQIAADLTPTPEAALTTLSISRDGLCEM